MGGKPRHLTLKLDMKKGNQKLCRRENETEGELCGLTPVIQLEKGVYQDLTLISTGTRRSFVNKKKTHYEPCMRGSRIGRETKKDPLEGEPNLLRAGGSNKKSSGGNSAAFGGDGVRGRSRSL